MKYDIVEGTSINNLTKVVNEYLTDGWEPFGNLTVREEMIPGGAFVDKKVTKYIQPLIKR